MLAELADYKIAASIKLGQSKREKAEVDKLEAESYYIDCLKVGIDPWTGKFKEPEEDTGPSRDPLQVLWDDIKRLFKKER